MLQDSEMAIRWSCEQVYRRGDVFHLLHVIPEPTMVHVWGGVYVPPDEDAEGKEVEDTKAMVTHRFAEVLLENRVPFKLHVVVGPVDTESVARVIDGKAADLGAALIVLAAHSKGRFKKMWIGSVTATVVRKSGTPVVVVPH